jgi:hypothetical protein
MHTNVGGFTTRTTTMLVDERRASEAEAALSIAAALQQTEHPLATDQHRGKQASKHPHNFVDTTPGLESKFGQAEFKAVEERAPSDSEQPGRLHPQVWVPAESAADAKAKAQPAQPRAKKRMVRRRRHHRRSCPRCFGGPGPG